MANFRIIDGDASDLLERRVTRLGAWGATLFILVPSLLILSLVPFTLIGDEGPVSDRVLVLGFWALLLIPLLVLTRKLIVGRRRIVLFLRRFGDRESLASVTRAAVGALGSGYRLVTLDDHSIGTRGKRRTLTVSDEESLEVALSRVRRLSRRLLGAKTVFLNVEDPIWRNVVLRLVTETNAVLIDVTESGPSLLWEIETVGAMVRPWWILVGEREALIDLANLDLNDREATSLATLAGLLRGEDVLAYRNGEDGGRFRGNLQARYDLVARYGAFRRTGPMVGDISSPDLIRKESAEPYDLEGPPSPWWPGRDADLPPIGPGSLASIGRRWAARGIDVAVGWLVFFVAAVIQLALSGIEVDGFRPLTSAALLILLVAYDPLTTLLLGATPGKRILHLDVIRAGNNQPASVALVGGRGLILLALWLCCVVPGVLDARAGASHPLKQTWHDRWTATLVVNARPPHG